MLGENSMPKVYLNVKKIIGKVVVIFMLGIFPFITHDALYDITITRYNIFLTVVIIAFLLMIVNELIHMIDMKLYRFRKMEQSQAQKSHQVSILQSGINRELRLKINLEDILIFTFFLICTLSWLLSDYRVEALTGAGSRYTGYLFMTGLCMLYVIVKRCYQYCEWDLIIIFASVMLINGLAVLNFCGIDPFGFFTQMKASSKDSFISTLGNIDIFAAYTSIFTPIAVVMFMKSKKQGKTIFYAIAVFFTMMGILVSNSDCAFVGLFTLIGAVVYLLLKTSKNVRRFLEVIIIFGVAVLVAAYLQVLGKQVSINSIRRFTGISGGIVSVKIAVIILLVGAILLICLNFKTIISRFDKIDNSDILRYILMCALFVIALALIFSFLYFSLVNKTANLGNAAGYFRFDDSWGTNRGYIWRISAGAYTGLPLLHRIFGTGEASFRFTISVLTAQQDSMYFSKILDSAHNELLHYMITIGVLGLVNYILIIGHLLKHLFTNEENTPIQYALGLAVLCYFVQSIFNIAQPITTPLLFIVLAILSSANNKNMKKGYNFYEEKHE